MVITWAIAFGPLVKIHEGKPKQKIELKGKEGKRKGKGGETLNKTVSVFGIVI